MILLFHPCTPPSLSSSSSSSHIIDERKCDMIGKCGKSFALKKRESCGSQFGKYEPGKWEHRLKIWKNLRKKTGKV